MWRWWLIRIHVSWIQHTHGIGISSELHASLESNNQWKVVVMRCLLHKKKKNAQKQYNRNRKHSPILSSYLVANGQSNSKIK